MGKRYTFVLNFGYVESAGLSFLPWTSQGSYPDAKAALKDLALYLKEQYDLAYAPKPKKCCVVAKTMDPEAKFCKTCGKSCEDEKFDSGAFMDFVVEVGTCDIDTFHGNFRDYSEEDRWQVGSLEDAPNPRFVYQAEKVMAAAIGHSPDDRVTIEDIFKQRTKRKEESFSFW